MLGMSTTLAAAAYLLLAHPGHPAQTCRTGWDGDTVCTAIAVPTPPCQLTMNMSPGPPPPRGNHITVDWVGPHPGDHYCRHGRHWRHGHCVR